MPTPTVEDYVKQTWMLRQTAGQPVVPMGELAGALGVSPGTVTTMVKAISKDGLLAYVPRVGVELTPEGEALALRVVRRHRILELYLVEKLGYDWSEVHEEAEILEHAVSERLIERMAEALGNPTRDPHGDPIPASDGRIEGESGAVRLSQCATGRAIRVLRVRKQPAATLDYLGGEGVKPGSEGEVTRNDPESGVVELRIDAGLPFGISRELAASVDVLEIG